MSQPYLEVLDATIAHLRDLKARGERYLPVSPELLNELGSTPGATRPPGGGRAQAPAPARTPARSVRPVVATTPATGDEPAPPRVVEPALAPAAAPLNPEEKPAAMGQLEERALVCQKCPNLVKSRKKVVFGVGDVNASLMFVGEAPGADEDVQGEPFVGKAGQLLTKIIQATGLQRSEVYIANVLKCRPDTPGQLYGNRKPRPDEMQTCLPYLLAQIDIIRPKVIVALGATAMEGLFGEQPLSISKARGRFHEFRQIPVRPTYHPSYLLRYGSQNIKRQVWEDMLAVMEILGMPISEKQRGYFSGSSG